MWAMNHVKEIIRYDLYIGWFQNQKLLQLEEMLLDNKIIINIRSNKNRESNEDFTALSCLLSVEIVEWWKEVTI